MIFIFDENYSPKFAEGLSLLEQGNHKSKNKVEVHHIIKFFGKKGATDEEIIEFLSKKNAVIITQDSDFKRIKHYKSLYKEHKVGAVFFKTYKQLTYWDMLISLLQKWEDLKEKLSKDTLPFVYEVNKKGIQPHSF
jgi:predicted nuclease of predicted toxin-antitoxin system